MMVGSSVVISMLLLLPLVISMLLLMPMAIITFLLIILWVARSIVVRGSLFPLIMSCLMHLLPAVVFLRSILLLLLLLCTARRQTAQLLLPRLCGECLRLGLIVCR